MDKVEDANVSDEDIQKVEELMKGLEKRLTDTSSMSKPQKNGLRGWGAAGVILGVLTAVTVPVLSVTWYAANKMNQLEGMQKDVDQTRSEVSSLRAQIGMDIAAVGNDIGEMRKDVQRLREAFAAYTQVILPMFTQPDVPFRLPQPPQLPPRSPVQPPTVP